MDFVHRPYLPGETIAAIATAPGSGGVAIVRISGKEAVQVASCLCLGPVKNYKSHTVHLTTLVDERGKKLDEALVLVMLGTRSFTGEETVEIQCHGGGVAGKKVLEAALKAGARLASPGEFTFKAFMNGKLDLAQAEALSSLISAKNETAFYLASQQLEGRLSEKIEAFQDEMTQVAAVIEAWIDFPDEGLEFATKEELSSLLEKGAEKISALVATFEEGRKLSTGITLCIVGAPNVGKSSLLNALLEKERAIVTDIAGTTRDVLEEEVTLNGLTCRLMDTAGIRETQDLIEKEGIRRSRAAFLQADLVLFVLDCTRDMQEAERHLLEQMLPEKTIVIWNKNDQGTARASLSLPYGVTLSAKTGEGMARLKAKIDEVIWKKGPPDKEEVLLSSARHKKALENAATALLQVAASLKEGISPEFLASDMRVALFELGTILGKNVTEEILTSIFSQFCIGK